MSIYWKLEILTKPIDCMRRTMLKVHRSAIEILPICYAVALLFCISHNLYIIGESRTYRYIKTVAAPHIM